MSKLAFLRRRLLLRRLAALAVAVVTVVPLVCATTSCSTSFTVSGTVRGSDGRFVDVMIGFDIFDSGGRKIRVNGGAGGYSMIQRINYCLPSAGSTTASPCSDGSTTTFKWSAKLPSGTAKVYVEAWPKSASSTSYIPPPGYRGYIGPNAGVTDTTYYGLSYRRELSPGSTNVSLLMPKQCGQSGGRTGSLRGRVFGLPPGATGSMNAWSLEANNYGILGMGLGRIYADGTYRIDGLEANSHYGLIGNAAGKTVRLVDYYHKTQPASFVASPCQVKTMDVRF